jgi:hypothetical protein
MTVSLSGTPAVCLTPGWISEMARAVIKTEIIFNGGVYAG